MSAKRGIEIRKQSIRIRFMFQGKQRNETLYLDNDPLPPTPANIKYAIRIAAEIRDKIRWGTFDYKHYFPHSAQTAAGSAAPLLFDVMDQWVRLHDLKPSTRLQYTRRLNSFWKIQLKNVPIDQVRYSDVLEALKTATWKSAKSRNNEVSMIRGVFEFAQRDKLIEHNPCSDIGHTKYQKPKPDPFDLEEANQILVHLKAHRPEPIFNFVQLMFFSGLRTSEGLALRWEHIDFHKREMSIEGGNVYDEESDSTKTSESRTVKFTAKALEALERQKAHTHAEGAHVFHDPKTGQPWSYQKITDVRSFWEITLKQLGIRYRRPYNMRHTYATIGLMSGAKPGFLADQLGHSLRMFFEVYAKWIRSCDDDLEMAKLDDAIGNKEPKKEPN